MWYIHSNLGKNALSLSYLTCNIEISHLNSITLLPMGGNLETKRKENITVNFATCSTLQKRYRAQ